jgi:hypothetical protein
VAIESVGCGGVYPFDYEPMETSMTDAFSRLHPNFSSILTGRDLPKTAALTLSLPKRFIEIGSSCDGKVLVISMSRGTPPKYPKSGGPESIGSKRVNFGRVGLGEVGSPAATTLENNDKFRPRERAENVLR